MSTEQMTGMSLAQKRELLARMLREKAAAPKKYPLSFAQQRLWFLDRLEPGNSFYNIPLALSFNGRLDVEALARTLDELVRRHEVFRTTFADDGGTPVQLVAEPSRFHIRSVDLRALPEAEREAEAQRITREDALIPFDLSRGPLLRVTLICQEDEKHLALLTMHHIISDGWSISVLIKEVAALYEAFSRGEPSPLPELQIQYADYSAWQRQRLQGEVLDQQLSYWKKQLGGELPVLELPTDRPRAAMPSHRGAHHTFRLDQTLTDGLRELSRREGCTLFMTLLAAFQLLLSRYSGQQDIIVGTPIAGRTRAELEPLIGFFINTLALRTDLSGEPTFAELLRRVREVTLGAYAHQEVPFEKLVEELRPERDTSRQPLFQVMFAMQNTGPAGGGGGAQLAGLELTPVLSGAGATSKFDLMLMVTERGGELMATFEYATDLFNEESIERMASHLKTLLAGVAAAPETPAWRLPLMCEEEREWVLGGCNETAADYERGATIHELFRRQAAATPDALAVIDGAGARLSFAELDALSDELARRLRRLGVGAESLVGIMLDRSAAQLVSLLGVMKAGGTYLPLDAGYPAERLAFMLSDSGARVLVTDSQTLARVPALRAAWGEDTADAAAGSAAGAASRRLLLLDAGWDSSAVGADVPAGTVPEPLSAKVVPDNLAYVIYTSGSTGTPKAVMIRHASALNLHAALDHKVYSHLRQRFGAAPLVVSLNAPLSFDASVQQWLRLISGDALAIVPEHVRLDAEEMCRWLGETGVQVLDCTPSHLRALAGRLPETIAGALVGGEAIDEALWAQMCGEEQRLYFNVYGPTECTVDATVTMVRGALPQLGRPVQNMRAYVVERGEMAGEVAPAGVAGELYLGGDGVARGYLGRAALTAERFVPDPYSTLAGGRLYRSGDLVRRLPDGRLEFLGRLDAQVKVRGYRIEPGEVEAALCAHDRVRAAVVTARGEGAGGKRLVGYYVCEAGGEVEAGELREHLRGRLPEYMVPAVLMALAELPLTGNGKVDRRALPEPSVGGGGGEGYVGPRTAVEEVLSGVYGRVLGMEAVGVRDNFFELGGHSLLALRLLARVEQETGVRLPVAKLFHAPTVELLARELEEFGEREHERWSPLVRIAGEGSGRPFFCVHPGGGNIHCYAALAALLGTRRPFYGLQARELEGEASPLGSIEEMASFYLEAAREVQPRGPYLLGGWSLGGLIAFEMAQQLRARGEEVEVLALIDTAIPGGAPLSDAAMLAGFAHDIGLPTGGLNISLGRFEGLGREERLAYIFESAKAAGVVPAEIEPAQFRRLLGVFENNVRAGLAYSAKPYPGRLTYFKAAETPHAPGVDAAAYWGEMAAGGADVHVLAGDHYGLLKAPLVAELAERLKACFQTKGAE
ncbi:MAG TPA: amino acid adenylation domain-containing protein [Pyrinomonadaceae bacterium]|nr:amino acid adenylation domain-containing protein [Pyrinomonadaceae bacterium]